MKKLSAITLLLMFVISLVGEVIPHPLMNRTRSNNPSFPSEKFPLNQKDASKELPQNVLVFMVQFPDVSFVTEASYPDFLVHDQAYFDRHMLQLSDYLYDASHGQYLLNYSFYPEVITLDREMAYYGSDEDTRRRIAEFAQEIVQKADPQVDFNAWDTFVVFHAGAGQETDISGLKPELIWSTFLSRRNLQLGLDEENDDYQGIPADGTYVTDFVIAPEYQWQSYFPQDGSQQPYGNLGVLASGFGYALGLPNLSDNVSENGTSAGIGNWGIMGSGAWNANGYTPAQLSAWCRYYLGWETPVEYNTSTYQVELDYFLDKNPTKPQLVKVNISEKEYFLIENREQNPDDSTLNGVANFTFSLLPEGEQDYYELQEGQWELVPKFNFMENRLKGCEWDFFLPGYSGDYYQPVDGSGLLIWHIDEFVIEEKFDPDNGVNRVNSDANHKGVDLEEADGIQHLDNPPGSSIYSYGGPEDAYRAGGNNYFGFNPHPDTGLIHIPSSESYYGGTPLEILTISEAGNTMSFDINFKWNISTGYTGLIKFPALSLNMLEQDSEDKQIYFPNGNKLSIYDTALTDEFQMDSQLFRYPSYDEKENNLLLPTQKIIPSAIAYLNYFDGTAMHTAFSQNGFSWTSPVIIHKQEDENNYKYFCPLNSVNTEESLIKVLDSDLNTLVNLAIPGKMKSNLLYGDHLMAITKEGDYNLAFIDEEEGFLEKIALDIPADSLINNILLFDFHPQYSALELIVQGKYGFYVYTSTDYSRIGYYESGVESTAIPAIIDFDKNATWDLLIGYKDGIKILTYNGELLDNGMFQVTSSPNDSLIVYGGAYALEIEDEVHLLGSFSRNRSSVWNDKGQILTNFPVSNYSNSRSYPFLHLESQKLYLYTSVDKGTINRSFLKDVGNDFTLDNVLQDWFTEYRSYHRNAVELNTQLPNSLETNSIFVDGQVYFYPNPFNTTINDKFLLRAMVSQKCQAKLDIYTISGKKVYSDTKDLDPYLGNMNQFIIPYERLTSGVYIARLKAEGEIKELKFALEK